MSHPRTACSTTSNNLCTQCAPLYTPLDGYIPAEQLNCPTLTTYPIILRIRVRPITNRTDAIVTHTIAQQLANVIGTQVHTMFNRSTEDPEPANHIPMVGTQRFRPEYTDLSIMVDLPYSVDLSDGDIDNMLGVAAQIPDLGYGQEGWRVEELELAQGQCAQAFRLGFYDEHLRESLRAARRRRELQLRRQQQQQQQQQEHVVQHVVLPAIEGGVPVASGFMLFLVNFVDGPAPQ